MNEIRFLILLNNKNQKLYEIGEKDQKINLVTFQNLFSVYVGNNKINGIAAVGCGILCRHRLELSDVVRSCHLQPRFIFLPSTIPPFAPFLILFPQSLRREQVHQVSLDLRYKRRGEQTSRGTSKRRIMLRNE